MGRIIASVTVQSATDLPKSLRCDALVDTGSAYVVLPSAWKDRLGSFDSEREIELEAATQELVKGTLCGPAKITIEGFKYIYNEVLFLDMHPPKDSEYEPLIGYLALEQCGAAVDVLGHRLVPVKYYDLK